MAAALERLDAVLFFVAAFFVVVFAFAVIFDPVRWANNRPVLRRARKLPERSTELHIKLLKFFEFLQRYALGGGSPMLED